MYAHEVIADMYQMVHDGSKSGKEVVDSMHNAAREISGVTKFHIGPRSQYGSLHNRYMDRVAFMDELSHDMMLPYRKMWVDWYGNFLGEGENANYKIKGGALLFQHTHDCFTIRSFLSTSHIPYWTMVNRGIVVSVGKKANENSYISAAEGWSKGTIQLADNIYILPWGGEFDKDEELHLRHVQETLHTINFSLMFMNCRNITTKDVHPDERLNKKRIKRKQQPKFTYKVLVLTGTSKERGESEVLGEHNRIHMCRGHFKTYTASKPLFGSITGRWWWQSHLRGQNKEGYVAKDYRIRKTLELSGPTSV